MIDSPTSPTLPIPSRAIRVSLVVIFLLCLGLNSYCSLIGFNDPISHHHAFRKTQTAISTYYTIQDGFKLAYETPVLGAPWSIPMEFPLYQWTVAAWTMLTGMPLDMSGRFVSLFFFYCCLPVIFLLGRSLGLGRAQSLLPLCLVLLCPLYIYWSRTFMIESMALFFSLSFLLCFTRYRQQGKHWLLALAVGCGILGGLVKITTLFISSIPILFWGASDIFNALREQDSGQHLMKRLARTAGGYALALVVPVIIALLWTHYADMVKARNPMADFLLSSHLTTWNFGTFAFRFSQKCWHGYMEFMKGVQIGSLWGLAALTPLFILKSPFRLWGIMAMCAYFAGPLVFANLYFVHDYYSYANTVFLLLAMGCGLLSLQRLPWGGAASLFLLLILAASFGFCYVKGGYLTDQMSKSSIPPQFSLIRTVTDPDDVIFINDRDWNSYAPYYMQRRALMNYKNFSLDTPKLQKALALTKLEDIKAVCSFSTSQKMVDLFQLHDRPIVPHIFLREDIYNRAFERLFQVDLKTSGPSELLGVALWHQRFCLSVKPGGSFTIPVPPQMQLFSAQVILPENTHSPFSSFQGFCSDASGTPQPLVQRSFTESGATMLTVALPEKNCQHLSFMRNPQDQETPCYWTEITFH